MSEPDDSPQNFLQRWSRRKHAHEQQSPPPQSADADSDADTNVPAPARSEAAADPSLPAFDPARLPPLESISAASDIRAFLAPGVPEELTRAALRRAWVADPTIRDFIGLAENQWDFTDPNGVPGFGSLEMTPDLRRMVARLVGNAPEPSPARPQSDLEQANQITEMPSEIASEDRAAGTGENKADAPPASVGIDVAAAAESSASEAQDIPQYSNNNAAAQNDFTVAGSSQRPAHRKHGGAVPK